MTILTIIRDRIHQYRTEHQEDPTVLLLTTERYDELSATAAFSAIRTFGQSGQGGAVQFGEMKIMVTQPDLLDESGIEVMGETVIQQVVEARNRNAVATD